jgi:hypothetical protein
VFYYGEAVTNGCGDPWEPCMLRKPFERCSFKVGAATTLVIPTTGRRAAWPRRRRGTTWRCDISGASCEFVGPTKTTPHYCLTCTRSFSINYSTKHEIYHVTILVPMLTWSNGYWSCCGIKCSPVLFIRFRARTRAYFISTPILTLNLKRSHKITWF